jgi:glycosyltransferase involved in cell wall biosynthesis
VKVLHILEATLGGTRQYLDDVIAARLDMDQALLHASARADSAWPAVLRAAEAAGWECRHIDMQRSIDPWSDLKAVAAIRAFIRGYRPAVIHCHSSKAGALGRVGALAAGTGAKVVYSPHALAHRMSRAYLYIERGLVPLTTRYCAVSESERREIAASGLAPFEQIAVASPAIRIGLSEPEASLAARTRLSIPVEAEVVIGVGRLVAQKDPLRFVEIIAPLLAKRPLLHAYWVGEGELRAHMEAEIAALGLDGRISITGWSTDVKSYLSAANLVVSTAKYESFGYAAAEALAMERPIVAANVSGIQDILDGSLSALMYDSHDLDAARALITRLLEEPLFRRTMTALGKAKVEAAYSLSAMKGNLEGLYSS